WWSRSGWRRRSSRSACVQMGSRRLHFLVVQQVSRGGPAAVERDGGPGDMAGAIAAQPHHQGSDVLRFDQPLDRGTPEQHLLDDVFTRDTVLRGLRVDLAV